MSSATDTIRAMLDERGVEWEACRVPTLRSELAATFWYDRCGTPCSAVEGADDVPDGMLSVQANLTPEQAIEATLGSAENAELRKERDALDHLTDVLNDSNDGLLAENAKLRELLAELYEDQCDECDEWKYADRMRELGVEV